MGLAVRFTVRGAERPVALLLIGPSKYSRALLGYAQEAATTDGRGIYTFRNTARAYEAEL